MALVDVADETRKQRAACLFFLLQVKTLVVSGPGEQLLQVLQTAAASPVQDTVTCIVLEVQKVRVYESEEY